MNKKFLGLSLMLACIVAFGSCKPKQSAYKSVYEAAQEKQLEDTYTPTTSVEKPKTTPTYASTNESVRKEKITPVYESDASGLKAYNVVIAAMGLKTNADALKKKIEADGYKVILVQNESGLYRVIISSHDTKDAAAQAKNQILNGYTDGGSVEALKTKYGIPFNDWWILQREY